MRVLDSAHLSEELGKCYAIPNYRLGIVLPTLQGCNRLCTDIVEQLEAFRFQDQIAAITNGRAAQHIRLKNGSEVRLLQSTFRGCASRFHTILFDRRINMQTLYPIFDSMETLYYKIVKE